MNAEKNLLIVLGEWWQQRQANRSEHRRSQWQNWLPSRGNVLFTLVMIVVLLWAQSAGAVPFRAESAASMGTVAYQGRLADSAGNPLTETLNMSFRLYSGSSGGAALWTEQWTGPNGVQVSDGLFNVMLGSLTPIAQSLITGNSNLFLGITVGTDDEMTPRVQLGSVPFAVQALTVPDGSITTAKIADGVVTAAKLSADVNLNTVQMFGVVKPDPVLVSNIQSDLVSKTIVISVPSDVLIMLNSRAISLGGEDSEILFNIFRDGTDLASNIHWSAKQISAHQYFNFTFPDTNLSPGTYTYTLKARLTLGSGTRTVHQPSISAIIVPTKAN